MKKIFLILVLLDLPAFGQIFTYLKAKESL